MRYTELTTQPFDQDYIAAHGRKFVNIHSWLQSIKHVRRKNIVAGHGNSVFRTPGEVQSQMNMKKNVILPNLSISYSKYLLLKSNEVIKKIKNMS